MAGEISLGDFSRATSGHPACQWQQHPVTLVANGNKNRFQPTTAFG
jgi:hypothetical protein